MKPGPGGIGDAVTAADAALERTGTMAAAGQPRAALANARQAVALYRRLAADEPDVYAADLATALGVLAEQLVAGGDAPAAVGAASEAVDIFRTMESADDPEAALFRPYRGAAMGELALRLHDAGREADALAAARETIALFDDLGADDRRRHHEILDRTRVLRLQLAPDEDS